MTLSNRKNFVSVEQYINVNIDRTKKYFQKMEHLYDNHIKGKCEKNKPFKWIRGPIK